MGSAFISVGENIHCTRSYKTDGPNVAKQGEKNVVVYKRDGKQHSLPIPQVFLDNADWQAGKVRHCAAAIWQGVYGKGSDREAGVDYLVHMAKSQEACGATYLDVNVDEFSTDVAERVKLMKWTAEVVQRASRLPLSIDSSNSEILRAGLSSCDKARATPLLNSVSLERISALDLVKEFKPCVVTSAAGEKDLPCTVEGRLENLEKLVPLLKSAGIADAQLHFDPLVFPVSTDPMNGKSFLDSVTAIRTKYGPKVHFAAGMSNISFGMPNRKLLNQVYMILAREIGADGGIVDPIQINVKLMDAMDRNSEAFKLARAALLGEDEYGMNYIEASRDGRI